MRLLFEMWLLTGSYKFNNSLRLVTVRGKVNTDKESTLTFTFNSNVFKYHNGKVAKATN